VRRRNADHAAVGSLQKPGWNGQCLLEWLDQQVARTECATRIGQPHHFSCFIAQLLPQRFGDLRQLLACAPEDIDGGPITQSRGL